MRNKTIFIIGIVILVALVIYGAIALHPGRELDNVNDKITIVSTLFPTYDFAKNIGGDKVSVTLLLPPGVEAHAFEPTPSDIVKINAADIFVYTGEFMEPWAHDIIEGLTGPVKVVDASAGIELMTKEEEHDHEKTGHHKSGNYDYHHNGGVDPRSVILVPLCGNDDDHHHGKVDPHIWLDFGNAKIMAQNIATALQKIDPENAEYYQKNLNRYQLKLTILDTAYRETLSAYKSQPIFYGGHFAFGYLARRYGLSHVAAMGFSPDAHPTPERMVALVEKIRTYNITYIFYEKLIEPRIAEVLAEETGTKMLPLHPAHNVAREEYERGVSFIWLMIENLANLAIGLAAQK
jgi:zinc transport system substrate-binding protein